MVLSRGSFIFLLIYKHCDGTEYICTRSTCDVTKFTMMFLLWLASTKPISGFNTHDYKPVSLQTQLQHSHQM